MFKKNQCVSRTNTIALLLAVAMGINFSIQAQSEEYVSPEEHQNELNSLPTVSTSQKAKAFWQQISNIAHLGTLADAAGVEKIKEKLAEIPDKQATSDPAIDNSTLDIKDIKNITLPFNESQVNGAVTIAETLFINQDNGKTDPKEIKAAIDLAKEEHLKILRNNKATSFFKAASFFEKICYVLLLKGLFKNLENKPLICSVSQATALRSAVGLAIAATVAGTGYYGYKKYQEYTTRKTSKQKN
jgi:hypothetical protein